MSQHADNMVPEIRFEGFGAKWSPRRIQELVDEEIIHPPQDGNHGEIHPKKSDYVQRGIPFIMANNIRDGELDTRNCSHITNVQAEALQKGFAKTGDVLLTHKGTVGETAIVGKSEFPFIMLTPQVTFYRISDSEKLDTNFLAASFVTNSFQDALEEVSGGGTRAYVGITQQRNLSITVPSDTLEQVQIGAYFKSLDRMIGLHQRKHDKLVTLKQAMLQKMFPQDSAATPKIRFKGFEEDWEEMSLEELVEVCSGRDYKHLSRGNVPVYGTGGYMLSVDEALSYDQDAVGIGRKGTIDKPYLLRSPFWTVDTLFYALPREDNDLNFVFSVFQMVDWKKKDESTGVPSLSQNAVNGIEVLTPHPAEQQKIGTYFRKLDELISKHATQLEKLKNIKSACLEKMFV